jgi:hypothetical protein
MTPELLQSLADASHRREELLARCRELALLHSEQQFAIGDLLAEGEKWNRNVYAEALEIFEACGYAKETVYVFRYVACAVETSIRVKVLSFSHHRAVAPYEPDVQRELLDHAVKSKLKVQPFKDYIAAKFAPEPKPTPEKPQQEEPQSESPTTEDSGHQPEPKQDAHIRITVHVDTLAKVKFLSGKYNRSVQEVVCSLLEQALELPSTQAELVQLSEEVAA